jgi:hypothetical protein
LQTGLAFRGWTQRSLGLKPNNVSSTRASMNPSWP